MKKPKKTVAMLARQIMRILLRREGEPIGYVSVGNAINHPYWRLSAPLGLIARYCIEKGLPPLQRLVVNRYGVPGNGYFDDVGDLKRALRRVRRKDWTQVHLPSSKELQSL